MKILVICDDKYHHEEVIKPGLEFLQNENSVTYAADMSGYSFDSKPLSEYDVVITAKDKNISKSNEESWLGEDVIKQYEDYANGGGGLIFLHAGSVLCKHSEILKNISGCSFESHPEQCEVDFCITSAHPIVSGAVDFTEKDEHYFIDFTASDADIFLKSRSNHGIQPAGYTRLHNGKGRVCVLTPGHNLSVFNNEQYKKIIKNAVDWCGGKIN
ncbi:MAG: ThuA domain-containing protein [Oscillospiraceae bacterium]|nr:ThuA domain-containing protein [Oscillospiraceae bacterium]